MKKTMRPNWLTDDEVEKEIAELKSSEFVKLARKEERIRYQRRQYLYTLRQYEKKGKELAKAGITMEALQAIANDEEE